MTKRKPERQMPMPTDISKLKDIDVETADTETIKL